jgi:hypothetical protein
MKTSSVVRYLEAYSINALRGGRKSFSTDWDIKGAALG